jgi:hypothetical protein
VKVPAKIKELGPSAFEGCEELMEVIFKGAPKLRIIGEDCFLGCYRLGWIEMPSSLQVIKTSAFEGCDVLHEVSFEQDSKLKTIEDRAFHDCPALKRIELPSVTQLIGSPFDPGCVVGRFEESSDEVPEARVLPGEV